MSLRRSLVVVLLAATPATVAAVTPAQAPSAARQHLVVPWRGTGVVAGEREGHAIVDGDISLGRVEAVAREPGAGRGLGAKADPSGNAPRAKSFAAADRLGLWPIPGAGQAARVPYEISTPGYPSTGAAIGAAIVDFNAKFAGVIQFVPQTNETDYVDFNLTGFDASGICFAEGIGRTGGVQTIGGSVTCTQTTLLHMMGHVVGLYHEHQRADAGTWVTYDVLNVDKPASFGIDPIVEVDMRGAGGNYGVPDFNAQQIGLYDYGSLMHLGRLDFSKNEEAVLETLPAGIPIGGASNYSAGDVDAIKRLYGATPASVIVTTHPVGLPIIVDGVQLVSPQTFNWPLNSQHTIAVPSAYQSGGLHTRYKFANWNDGQAISHTVTVTPGNRARTQPEDRPAVTVYQAAFQKYVDLDIFPAPTGGTISITPTPLDIDNNGTPWVLEESVISTTATPEAGKQFYAWTGQQAFSAGANPRTFRIPFGFFNIAVAFVPQQTMYTVASQVTGPTPPTSPRHPVLFGSLYYPVNFIASDGWTPGATDRQVDAPEVSYPALGNVEYEFISWSDGGAAIHTLAALPAQSTTYTATFTANYKGYSFIEPACASNSPTISNQSYPDGTVVPFAITPVSGWTFAGWTDALAGNPNSTTNLTVHDQFAVTARFNTISTPLRITGFVPATVEQGQANVLVQVKGTGFTLNTTVTVNGAARTATYVNPTRLDITLTQADLANDGGLRVAVVNSTTSPACELRRQGTLQVSTAKPNTVFENSFE